MAHRRYRSLSDYLSEEIDFGGEFVTRAEAFRLMEADGISRRGAELWMLGHDTSLHSTMKAAK